MSMRLPASARRHTVRFLFTVFVVGLVVLGSGIYGAYHTSAPARPPEDPVSIGTYHGAAPSLAASLLRIGERAGQALHVVQFQDGETRERILPGTSIVFLPQESTSFSLAQILRSGSDAPSIDDVVFYGYQYVSRDAATERAGHFAGTYFASRAALLTTEVQEIAARRGVTFRSLADVRLMPGARFIIVTPSQGVSIDLSFGGDDAACTINRETMWREQFLSPPRSSGQFSTDFPDEGGVDFQVVPFTLPRDQKIGYVTNDGRVMIGAERPYTLHADGALVWNREENHRSWTDVARSHISGSWVRSDGGPALLRALPVAFDPQTSVAYVIATVTDEQYNPSLANYKNTLHQWLLTIDVPMMTLRTSLALPVMEWYSAPGTVDGPPQGSKVLRSFIDQDRSSLVHVSLDMRFGEPSSLSVVSRALEGGNMPLHEIGRTSLSPSQLPISVTRMTEFLGASLDEATGDLFIATREDIPFEPRRIRVHRIVRGDDGYRYDRSIVLDGTTENADVFTLSLVGSKLLTVVTGALPGEASRIVMIDPATMTVTQSVSSPSMVLKLFPVSQQTSSAFLLFHGEEISYNMARRFYGSHTFLLQLSNGALREVPLMESDDTNPSSVLTEIIRSAFVESDGSMIVASTLGQSLDAWGTRLISVPLQLRRIRLSAACSTN